MSVPKTLSRISTSKYVAILISAFVLVAHYYTRKYIYLDFNNVLGWDALAYYMYLPYTFIHGDPGMSNHAVIEYIFSTYNPSPTFYQGYPLPNGNWSSMYSIGYAILYFPFFLIGHIWALLSDYPADGFSYPYQFTIANGVMFYIISGIFIIRKVLLSFFKDNVVALVLIAVILGTNFFHESIADEVGPQAMMFAMFSLILLLTIKWHKKPEVKTAFFLGLILGLAILARGSAIFIVFVIAFWNVYDKESFLEKVQLVFDKRKQILIGILGLAIFPLIQFIYWKIYTGTFFFNPYKVTPGFNWLEPQFLKVLFSYKKGWLLYTPIMAFAIIGLFFLLKKNKKIATAVIGFVIINVYVLSSWGTWWGGGSFGGRYFVESYAILSIPLGYFIATVFKKPLLKWVFIGLGSFFVFLNLFQTWQFNNFMFDGYNMTKAYYWKLFLKTSVTAEDRKLAAVNRDFGAVDYFTDPQDYTKYTAEYLDFENINTIHYDSSYVDTAHYFSPPNSYLISPEVIYGPTFRIPYDHLTKKEHAWMTISFQYLAEHDLNSSSAFLVVELNHNKGQYIEKRRSWDLKEKAFQVGKWNSISVDYLTPFPLSVKNDDITIYIYLEGDIPIYLDNFKVEAFERKW